METVTLLYGHRGQVRGKTTFKITYVTVQSINHQAPAKWPLQGPCVTCCATWSESDPPAKLTADCGLRGRGNDWRSQRGRPDRAVRVALRVSRPALYGQGSRKHSRARGRHSGPIEVEVWRCGGFQMPTPRRRAGLAGPARRLLARLGVRYI